MKADLVAYSSSRMMLTGSHRHHVAAEAEEDSDR
jgi:hypothetical protein